MLKKSKKERQQALLHRMLVYAQWMQAEGKYLEKCVREINEEMVNNNSKRTS